MNDLIESILLKIKELKLNIDSFEEINFEKDIPEKGHIDFIHAISNLRAKNYNIPQCDKYKTFKVAGKTGAQTISTTACTSGFLGLQLILLTSENEKLYSNYNFNLSTNICVHNNIYKQVYINDSENHPIYNCPVKVLYKFSQWDKIIIKESKTLSELIDYFKNIYNMKITLIEVDKVIIYKKQCNKKDIIRLIRNNDNNNENENEKLNKKIEVIYSELMSQKDNYYKFENLELPLFINVSGYIQSVKALVPAIKYSY